MGTIKIGWIGIGNMGVPMVKNLVKAGFELTLYNRTTEKAAELAKETGAAVAHTPADLLAESDFIITMLSDDAAVTEVYNGKDGLLSAAPGKKLVCIDMSTVSPETTKKLAGLCAGKGIAYLDAPVSGSVKPAEDAQLVIMVGGKQADYEAAKPVFDKLGKLSLHLGDNGAGNNAKLAINLFLAITMQGLGESMLFAEKKGISNEQFLEIVNNGALASGITKIKTPSLLNNSFPAAFALKHLAKDLVLAQQQGMNQRIGTVAAETYQLAKFKGLGEEDMAAVVKVLHK